MDYFKKKNEILKKVKEIRKKNNIKKEKPKNIVFINCEVCGSMLFEEQNKNRVCHNCGHHFKISPLDRLNNLMDYYAIIEFNKYFYNPLSLKEYEIKKELARKKTSLNEAVLIVKGSIKNMKCYVFVMDSDFLMGSMGIDVGERISTCFDLATKEGLPVIGFCTSGGARMQEGIFSLMQMANTTFSVRQHSENGNFYLAVLTDPTTGGVSASFANLADVIVAEPSARICFTGRRVIEETINQKLPEDFQTSEFLINHGFLDGIVSRKEHRDYIGSLLKYHRSKK